MNSRGTPYVWWGRNPIFETKPELSVISGIGIFRMARGYAITTTYSYDVGVNYGMLEYTIYVAYFEDEECDY